MWSPSSLIFLVLLGVWAAYFLQYWIRRRDHLATARSVEQFSEAMRVLERRDTTPRTDLSEPAPRSWNVHPGRPSTRPQVLVKRAVASEPPSPVVTARIGEPSEEAAPVVATAERAPERPRRDEPRVERPAATAPRPTREAPAARPATAPLPRRVRPGRRLRASLMLVALAELIGISVLVPLGYLQWWALAPAVVAFVGSFAYLRAGVRAEQRLRAAHRRRRAEARRSATRRPEARRSATRRPEATPAPARTARPASTDAGRTAQAPVEASPTADAEVAVSEPAVAEVAVAEPAVEPAEVATPAPEPVAEEPLVEVAEHIEYVHLVDEDDIPLTWEPVPVPRPTYTMKARAERPEVPPAETTPDPEPVSLPDEDGVPERRVAGA